MKTSTTNDECCRYRHRKDKSRLVALRISYSLVCPPVVREIAYLTTDREVPGSIPALMSECYNLGMPSYRLYERWRS